MRQKRIATIGVVILIAAFLSGCTRRPSAGGQEDGPQFTGDMRAYHAAIIDRYLQDNKGWVYYSNLELTKVQDVIVDKGQLSRLERLFTVTLAGENLKVGDRMPFALISPAGTEALAVFIKTDDHSLFTVPLKLADGEWTVGKSRNIPLK